MKNQVIETVTIAQAHDAIVQSAQVYFAKDQEGRPLMERRRARPICLMGPPGIGKTEIVREAAKEMGLGFLSYSITHHTRQSIIGLPRLIERTIDGRTVSMTEYTMSEIIAEIYHTMENTGCTQGILFLDEFNCASESLRPILLQLLQDKTFGPHPIPDGWMLVLAGNPPEYNLGASDMDPVTADRMRLLHVKPDYATWRNYAQKKGVHPVILSFLDHNRDSFYSCTRGKEGTALVTARGWEDLSCMLNCLDDGSLQPELSLVAQFIQSADTARSFYTYWTQYSTFITSGLMAQTLKRSPKALSSIQKMDAGQKWSFTAALLHELETQAIHFAEKEAIASEVYTILKSLPTEEQESRESLILRISDALSASKNPAVRSFLTKCTPLMTQDGLSAVAEKFRNEVRAPFLAELNEASKSVENAIAVCRIAMEKQPQLEFLITGLSNDKNLVKLLSMHHSDEFKSLFQDTYFDPSSALGRLIALTDELNADHPKEAAV